MHTYIHYILCTSKIHDIPRSVSLPQTYHLGMVYQIHSWSFGDCLSRGLPQVTPCPISYPLVIYIKHMWELADFHMIKLMIYLVETVIFQLAVFNNQRINHPVSR